LLDGHGYLMPSVDGGGDRWQFGGIPGVSICAKSS
jgi:hypothetical protein